VVLFAVHRLIATVLTALPPDAEARYLFTHLRWVFDPLGYAAWIGLAFGAGQLCSMFFRSGVLAAALGVVLASLLLVWAVLMHMLAIGFWWSVAPLIVAMFAATWLRANGWMLERNHARAWLPTLLALAVPTLSILAAVPVYRVWEIPDPKVDLAIAAPTPPSAAANEAARLFLLACERLPLRTEPYSLVPLDDPGNAEPTAAERQWLQENEAALNETLDALAALPADATIQAGTPRSVINWPRLATMIVRSGQIAETAGDLDVAWRRYQAVLKLARFLRRDNGAVGEVTGSDLERAALTQFPRCGARKGQTLERIHTALDEVSQLERHDEPLADVVRRDYADNLEVLNEAQAHPDEWGREAVLMARYAPWEFTRARRLLKLKAGLRLHAAQQLDMGLSWQAAQVIPATIVDAAQFSTTTWLFHDLPDLTSNRRLALCYRRGTQLALVAEAYRVEHGQLPQELSDIQAKHFERAPVDPFYNCPIAWFPWGLRITVRSQNVAKIPAGTPFVYLLGPAKFDNDSLQKPFRLRRQSADDPIVRVEASSMQGGLGAPAAAGPAGPITHPSMGMAAGALLPAAAASVPSFDQPAESLEGLAFPVPGE
jgi:hypothetical protein